MWLLFQRCISNINISISIYHYQVIGIFFVSFFYYTKKIVYLHSYNKKINSNWYISNSRKYIKHLYKKTLNLLYYSEWMTTTHIISVTVWCVKVYPIQNCIYFPTCVPIPIISIKNYACVYINRWQVALKYKTKW